MSITLPWLYENMPIREYAYTKLGIKIGKFALTNLVTKLKKRENTSWLKEIDSRAIQQSIANIDKAYQHFFKGGGFLTFKSRHHSRLGSEHRG